MTDFFEPFSGDVTCPHCGSPQKFLMHPYINAKKDPELKKKLQDCTIFDMVCTECGQSARIGYLLFYHDPDRRLLFYTCDKKNLESAETLLSILRSQNEWQAALHGCRIRAYHEPPHLSEGIIIAEHGLDDRVIALMKVVLRLCYTTQEHKPEPERLFLMEASGLHFLAFQSPDSLPEVIAFDRSLYDYLESHYAPFFPTGAGANLIVDEAWATHLLTPEETLQ